MAGRHTMNTNSGTATAAAGRDWKHRATLIGVTLLGLLAGYLALTAIIPRWWSQRVGKAVNGQMSTGTVLGTCIGLTFTLLPLTVLWFALRSRRPWKTKAIWALVAVVLAAPNLCTLAVAIGIGSASHAGQRIMDVDAPAFRGATLTGTLLAVAIFTAAVILIRRGHPPRRPKAPAPTSVPPATAA